MSEIAARGHAADHQEHHEALQHHFTSLEQQREASALGMWVFIAQEVLFFGGLFATYTVYRMLYPDAFSAGSHHLMLTKRLGRIGIKYVDDPLSGARL